MFGGKKLDETQQAVVEALQSVNHDLEKERAATVAAFLTTARELRIDTPEEYDRAGALLVRVTEMHRNNRDRAKAITDPLWRAWDATRKVFDPTHKPLERAGDLLRAAREDYLVREERERRRMEAEAERKAIEAAEAKLAAEAEAAREEGDDQTADEIEERIEGGAVEPDRETLRVSLPSVAPRVEAPGIRKATDWRVEIEDVRLVCKAIAEGKLSTSTVDVKVGPIKRLAKKYGAARVEEMVPGVKVTEIAADRVHV